jgi:hypothetical protein
MAEEPPSWALNVPAKMPQTGLCRCLSPHLPGPEEELNESLNPYFRINMIE